MLTYPYVKKMGSIILLFATSMGTLNAGNFWTFL